MFGSGLIPNIEFNQGRCKFYVSESVGLMRYNGGALNVNLVRGSVYVRLNV